MARVASDQITIVDVMDGYSVELSTPALIFEGQIGRAKAGSLKFKITAKAGAVDLPATVNVANITGKPASMTIVSDSGNPSPELTVTVTTAFTTPTYLVIPIVVDGLTFTRTLGVSFAPKGDTGAPGGNAPIAGLKNQAHMIVCDVDGKAKGAQTIVVDGYAFQAGGRIAATITAPTGLPSGMSAGTPTAGTTSVDPKLSLTVANGATLGGADSGVVTIPVVAAGVTFPCTFSWSKAKAGIDGVDPVTLQLSSSNGLIFRNDTVDTVLSAVVRKGTTELSVAQIKALPGCADGVQWEKNGVVVPGQKGLMTWNIGNADVASVATFNAFIGN